MERPGESLTVEVARLRGCLNDLVSVMALPVVWAGGEPARIVDTLLGALLEMLHLEFAFVRLRAPDGKAPLEMLRVAGAVSASAIEERLESWLGDPPSTWPPRARMAVGDDEFALTIAGLGLQHEFGLLIAGSTAPLGQIERVLLNVAANQAVIGLQQARLLSEQKRVARDLDARVAERSAELAAAYRESRLILDNIPGLVALLAPDGEVEVLNRQLREYFGQTLEELKQWGTSGAVHSEDLPHVIERFGRSIASGSPYEIVQRFRRWDGAYRWFLNSGFPLRDAAGRIVHWCVLLTDIDDRKRAEDEVRASERNLKQIIDTMPAMAWSARPDGTAEFFNRHYLDFVGLAAEEARDWGWTRAVHADDLDGLAANWQQVLASGAPGEAEARLRRRDGQYRWFLFRVNPLRDEQGTIVKWYGVNTDIEDRRHAEAELKRSELLLVEGQRISLTGTFAWQVDSDALTFSQELHRIFELPMDAPITLEAIAARVHPEDHPLLAERMQEVRAGRDNPEYEIRLRMPDQRVKHLRVFGRVIRHPDGRLECVGAVQDVTRRRLAEEARDKVRTELAHVTRVMSLGALTASVAHEVNQPLSGIITNASTCLRMLAADPPDVDGARETARRTIRDGNRASEVVARLRALFSHREFTPEPFDLNEATREVLELSLGDLQRHRVVLQSELAEDLPPVMADRVQLQQVILNLLRNASEAMSRVADRPRHLLIKTQRDEDDRVRVSVRDAGDGLDPQAADALFEAFYTTKSGGMGIGLSVSRAIVERHQGRLWAEPNGGPGATFSFSIPRDRPGVAAAPPPVRAS